jgi:glucoamylase
VARGTPASWAEGAKAVIGTALGEASRVWFTLACGRLTEVFYPTPDRACTRSLDFVVAGERFASNPADDAFHRYTQLDDGVPLVAITSRDRAGRYRLERETVADPRSSVVLQRVQWVAPGQPRLYCVLTPHVDNRGDNNHAMVFEHLGAQVLAAHRAGVAVALACSQRWARCTAGVAGDTEAGDLRRHHALTRCRARAHGQVELIGELDLASDLTGDRASDLTGDRAGARTGDASFVLALGFAHTPPEAAHLALGALSRGYDTIRGQFAAEWRAFRSRTTPLAGCRLWTRSVTVLKALEAKRVDGGRVAALATPWGPARGPGIAGTYHLVWTRDLVESAGGLLASGIHVEAREALAFLTTTQRPDGHWPQSMLLDGEPVPGKAEHDEAALPILLVDLLRREQAMSDRELQLAWPMIARAAHHLVQRGPTTALDRWEDAAGATPFTIATEIAALVCAAEIAARLGDARSASRFHATAERWDAEIEPLLYRRGGALADAVGVDGYYVRARVPDQPFPDLDLLRLPATEVSPDALALVRFGVREPDDPRIRNTVRVIDAVLAAELPGGQAWRRYPGDEYGEHPDGAPFDGHGVGRPWPLLVGERAHYELAGGDRDAARRLLHMMERCASETGMLPEQVWDGPDLADRGLFRGGPTGSAAPLGWAHAEYIKLCRSLADGRVFDRPSVRLRTGPAAEQPVHDPSPPGP